MKPSPSISAATAADQSTGSNAKLNERKKALVLICQLTILFGVAAWAYNALSQSINGDASSVDASACFAVVNARVLLQNVTEVPSTQSLSGALAGVSQTAPISVSVVQRSPSAIGIEFAPNVAKAHPDLARAYANVEMDTHRIGAQPLAHLPCPSSGAAREKLSEMVAATYPER